jgi:hypothetical protein
MESTPQLSHSADAANSHLPTGHPRIQADTDTR